MKNRNALFLIIALLVLPGVIAVCCSIAETMPYENLLDRAESYQKKGRYLEALSFYEDIYANKWSRQVTMQLYKGLADIYYGYLGDSEKALFWYGKIIEAFPDSTIIPSMYHMLARINYRKGARQESVKYFKDILSLYPVYYEKHAVAKELKTLEQGGALLDDVTLSVDRPLPLYVRVLIEQSTEAVQIVSEDGLLLYAPEAAFFQKKSGKQEISLSVCNARIQYNGHDLQKAVRITSPQEKPLSINGRKYRGFVWVRVADNQLMVINHVGLEEYLYGVVPREISPSWPEHALKTQAIAARTYALYHMIKREKELYDVFSTTSSQVYGGKDVEHRATKEAIDATKGLIVSYGGRIALTLYHANSGGITERVAEVWGSDIPYLASVPDEFSVGKPGSSWKKKLSVEDIQQRLQEYGLPVTRVMMIEPVERAESGRIKKLEIQQPEGSFYLSGNSFRLIVGPGKVKSANFVVQKEQDTYLFQGKGYGHGVGMSQWGAREMAKKGYEFRSILGFYYKGTAITEIKSL